MKKVKIYYGSKKWFDKNRPSLYRNLTEVINELDEQKRKNIIYFANMPKNNDSDNMIKDITKKPSADILVVDEGEYSGVKEHVIMNFANLIGEIDVNTLILQNPPKQIRNQLEILYPEEKDIIEFEYEKYNLTERSLYRNPLPVHHHPSHRLQLKNSACPKGLNQTCS